MQVLLPILKINFPSKRTSFINGVCVCAWGWGWGPCSFTQKFEKRNNEGFCESTTWSLVNSAVVTDTHRTFFINDRRCLLDQRNTPNF